MADAALDQLLKTNAGLASDFFSRGRAAEEGINSLSKIDVPLPKVPKLAALPKPPSQPKSDALEGFAGLAPLLSVLGGFLTRRPLVASLNALAASNNAFHAGQQEGYIRNLEAFRDNLDVISAQNRQDLESYNAALNNAQLTQAQKVAEIQTLASERRDDFMMAQDNLKSMATAIAAKENIASRMEAARLAADSRIKAAEINSRKPTAATMQADLIEQKEKELGRPMTADEKAAFMAQSKVPTGALIDDDTANLRAEQALAGDTSALSGLGFGTVGNMNKAKILERVKTLAKERGISGEKLAAINAEFAAEKAGLRAIGQRSALLDLAATEATGLADQVVETSNKVPRGEFSSINRFSNGFRAETGDPAIVQFTASVNSFVQVYARAVQPTGVPTDSIRQHAYEMINTAMSQGQVKAAIDQLQKEIKIAQKAPEAVALAIKGQIANQPDALKLKPGQSVDVGTEQNPATPLSDQEFDTLPVGSFFRNPADGKIYKKAK